MNQAPHLASPRLASPRLLARKAVDTNRAGCQRIVLGHWRWRFGISKRTWIAVARRARESASLFCAGALLARCMASQQQASAPRGGSSATAVFSPQVRYAGFALSGRHADLKRTYRYASKFFGQGTGVPGGMDVPGAMRKMLADQRTKAPGFKLLRQSLSRLCVVHSNDHSLSAAFTPRPYCD